MKKLFAITLLFIHLFNVGGYAFLFRYLAVRAETKLVRKLDTNAFDESKLILLKVPVQLPYINDSKGYERVDGEIEMDGRHFNYVKRKIAGNILYLLCLPNDDKTTLDKGQHDYANQVNNLPANKKSSGSGISKTVLGPEYNHPPSHFSFIAASSPSVKNGVFVLAPLSSPVLMPAYNPPEAG